MTNIRYLYIFKYMYVYQHLNESWLWGLEILIGQSISKLFQRVLLWTAEVSSSVLILKAVT